MTSTNPPEGPGPEYLEQGSGTPVGSPSTRTGPSRRTAVLAGGGVLALALVGGGVWAAMSFFGQGAQPAEALPAGTIGYASLDLDPSGGQKIEAFQMLRKFPAIKDQLDEFGLTSADEDIKEKVFGSVQDSGACPDVSYAQDIAPWLGDRFAVAAVDLGQQTPSPVVVVQVTDQGAAEDGLAKLKDCAASAAGSGDLGGWAFEDGWAVLAQTEDVARQVTTAAAKATLADDEDYQKWTGEVGDAGVLNFYVAPEAGPFLAELSGNLDGMLGGSGYASSSGLGSDMGSSMMSSSDPVPPQLLDGLKNFKGMAGTLRFEDGALELAYASGSGPAAAGLDGGEPGSSVVSTLPDDTAAAIGIGLPDGWGQKMLDNLSTYIGPDADRMVSEVEQQTGLTLPDDLETLLGDSASLSLSSSFDPEALVNSSDGSDVPIGLKVKGDADAIEGVLSKLAADDAGIGQVLQTDAKDGYVAIGPNDDYRSELLGDGSLGDSDVYQNVIREDDANGVLFVNFDAGDWLTGLVGDDPTAQANVDPLEGLGMTAWQDADVSHVVVRLTTD